MSKVQRRQFLVAAGGLLALPLARAQKNRLPKIGFLVPNPGPKPGETNPIGERIRELGWIPDKTATFEVASAEGREDRLPALAVELVAKKVDVIWVAGPEAAVAAARATQSIPIAFYGVGYPVEMGLVDSLAKPARNITGLASGTEAWPKALEVLKEIAPDRRRLAQVQVETVMETVSGARLSVVDLTLEAAAASSDTNSGNSPSRDARISTVCSSPSLGPAHRPFTSTSRLSPSASGTGSPSSPIVTDCLAHSAHRRSSRQADFYPMVPTAWG